MLTNDQITRLTVERFAQSVEHRSANASERPSFRHPVNRRMLYAEQTCQLKRSHAPVGQHLAESPFNRHERNVAATEHTHKLTLAACIRNGYISTMAKMDSDDRPYCGGVLTVREWRNLKARFGNRCTYCGEHRNKLVPEHVEPLSRGGEDARENIVPACQSCNCSKADLMLLEWVFAKHGPCKRVAFCKRYEDGYTCFDKMAGLLPTIRFIKPLSVEA